MAARSCSEETKLTVIRTLKKLRRPCTTLDLASALGLKRSEVNPFLYDLQRQGLIRKVQESNPPMWDLTSEGSMYGLRRSSQSPVGRGRGLLAHVQAMSLGTGAAGATSHGAPPRNNHSHLPTQPQAASRRPVKANRSDLQRQILQVLSQSGKALTALEVAHRIGLRTRKEVNPDLYAMQREGVLSMTQNVGPPLFELASEKSPAPLASEAEHSLNQPREVEEKMEVESYSSSKVDLSLIPEGSVRERLLAVMRASPELSRTELELRNAIQTTLSRQEVRKVLDSLLVEGLVKKTYSIPTRWSLVSDTASPSSNPTPLLPGIGGPKAHTSPGGMSFFPTPGAPSNPPAVSAPSNPSALPVSTASNIPSSTSFPSDLVNDMNKNPVSALMEYCQANKFDLSFVDVNEFGPPHMKTFVIAAQFGGERFAEVQSSNKKDAKRKAADLALQVIRQRQADRQVQISSMSCQNPTGNGASGGAFPDKIAELAHMCYMQVQTSIDLPQPGRKVVAAFVMEDVGSGEMKVVSVGSGTRCITGDHMSLEGMVVNDSHAEVVARRSLMRYFYKQLTNYYHQVDSIFEQCPTNQNLVQVKSDLKFHLYISTAPCGDGAQFSRCDDPNRDPPPPGQGHAPTMQGKQQGILRTKMEGGEGTIPIGQDSTPLTWDGIMQGGRLRTMSCSDKVGRWNVLGLQGSLLSLFMSPVYMSSLTLGSLHHHGHLSRAVCCRFAEIGDALPAGFVVNHPSLGRVQAGDEMKRHTEKTSNFSVNWACGDERGELVDGGNGRPVPPPGLPRLQAQSVPARVAKIKLYAEFVKLVHLCNRGELLSGSYKETKELAGDFQEAKQVLYQYCRKKGYGCWMRKPIEEEQFGKDVLERLNLIKEQ